MDTVSGTVVFTSPAAENDELLRVSDMDLRGDGTYFLVDEQKWSVNAFHSGGGTWSSLGTTGSYTPGTDILSYPQAAGANGERSYIAMHGGGAVLQVFDSAGAHITDIDVGSAGYGNITDIELYDSGNFTVWDDDSKQIGYFEVGKPDERRAPFDTESVQFCDLERYGERIYAAVSYSGESVIGYFSGTDFSEGNFTVLWSSGSEAFFNMDLGYHQPFAVSHVDVTENGIWTVFPAIASAVKFTQSGELIGSVCLDEGFGGQRVLPGRLYDFRSAAEDGDGGVAVGGFSASEAVEDGVSVDYITVFDNDSARLRSYRIIFPADE